jgi:small-conductance mechanosensitive channel
MGEHAAVHSIEGLKDFRVALALFAEDALSALGAVDMEVKRTVHWVHYDRRAYWQEQIKRRREQVAMAQAEVFRRKLSKTADSSPAMSEQKELLRKAEASLHDAERRVELVKKWEPALQQAVLEYKASRARIKNLASGDVPRAIALLERLIVALEAYLSEAPPSVTDMREPLVALAESVLAAPMEAEETVADEVDEDDEPAPTPG